MILQALLHCAIDGGLSAVFWGLDEVHKWSVQDSLPQGDLNHKVASQFGPDDSRVKAVSCYSSSCRCKKKNGMGHNTSSIELLTHCMYRFFTDITMY